jgi:hypothetical protein
MFDQIVSTKIEDGKVTFTLAKHLESLRKYVWWHKEFSCDTSNILTFRDADK